MAAQGGGSPPPSQEEILAAKDILVSGLNRVKTLLIFTGPCHMVGLDDNDEPVFFDLSDGQTLKGVYLAYTP